MIYKCELIERPAQPTLAIHTHCPQQDLPRVIPSVYETIAQYLGQIGHQPSGAPFAAYYNMDMQNLDTDIGFLNPENVPGRGNIQPGSIPGGKAAVCLHVGPYATIGEAHDALHRWVAEKGYQSKGAYYEIYLNNPNDTPPEALQTQIFTLIKSD